ncbi:MAG: DNA repair protein RecO [Candidatus Levybacteria bacterium RIFCSPHIGHO2_01_FULL_37_17]|nr:MAG: DNA repair protein RecO [Candidatus Levybacteria bacterium RIFCSPHIGHO2_01_FULL_37_17]OGH36663.1 MAG: DNA repair protein RecO [Candidatus Levybacteria bacterium RIFCSPLOWO2_01_FULL_38_23]
MRSYKTEGIVIKRISLAEADRIVTIFSKTHGKISVFAKGVRKITSRRSPHIELLNYSKFSLHKGKNMFTLSEAESIHNFHFLKKDLKKVSVAYHVCELIDSLCAENEHSPQVFELLKLTLEKVEKEENSNNAIANFEIILLKLLGFFRNEASLDLNRHKLIENILERKLKAKQFWSSF